MDKPRPRSHHGILTAQNSSQQPYPQKLWITRAGLFCTLTYAFVRVLTRRSRGTRIGGGTTTLIRPIRLLGLYSNEGLDRLSFSFRKMPPSKHHIGKFVAVIARSIALNRVRNRTSHCPSAPKWEKSRHRSSLKVAAPFNRESSIHFAAQPSAPRLASRSHRDNNDQDRA